MANIKLTEEYFYTDLKGACSTNEFDAHGRKTYKGEADLHPFDHTSVMIDGEVCLVTRKTFCETEGLYEVGLVGDEVDPDYKPKRADCIKAYTEDFPDETQEWDIKI